jgi:hypothetical protein
MSRWLKLAAAVAAAMLVAGAEQPMAAPGGKGAVVVKQSLCKISVGQRLPSGSDEVFTSDSSAVLTPSQPGVSTRAARATIPGWTGGSYQASGFACIINRTPVGGGFVCTTDSRTTVNASGKASLDCKCKLTDSTCKPVETGREPCAP